MNNKGNIFHFKQGKLFMWHFQLLGSILILCSLYAVFNNIILAIILVLIGMLLMTSSQGLIIDLGEADYFDYTTYIFYKTGERKKFKLIDMIYINKVKMKQQLYSPKGVQGFENSFYKYKAYIKFHDGDKVLINSSRNKEKLIGSLKDLILQTNQTLIDNT